jgi:predicted CDP-diglyceride synthetase/phosphatidate cytidylyltransferase
MIYYAIELATDDESTDMAIGSSILILCAILWIISIYINIFRITIRRLHDMNLNGWWVMVTFLSAVPLISGIFHLTLFFWPGTKSMNRFGEQMNRPIQKDYIYILFAFVALTYTVLGFREYVPIALGRLESRYPEYYSIFNQTLSTMLGDSQTQNLLPKEENGKDEESVHWNDETKDQENDYV